MVDVLLFNPMIRFEPVWLTYVAAFEFSAIVLMLTAMPFMKMRNMALGAKFAAPILQARLAKSVGKWQARGEKIVELKATIAELKLEVAALKDKHAKLAGAMLHTFQAAELGTETEQHKITSQRLAVFRLPSSK